MGWASACHRLAPDQFTHDEPMPKAYKPLPPAEELWETFHYRPLTGELIYAQAAWNKQFRIGTVAGATDRYGYRYLLARNWGGAFKIHRIVWCWMTGADPGDQTIDHVNLNPSDNRWHNLRLADLNQQQYNRGKTARGITSKYKGVSIRQRNGWKPEIVSTIAVEGQKIRIGSFATEEDAHAAYCAASKVLHGDHGRTA